MKAAIQRCFGTPAVIGVALAEVAAMPAVQVLELERPTVAVRAKSAAYRPELDMLRFFSFLLVFVTHTFGYSVEHLVAHHVPWVIALVVASLAIGGRMGVDLFFLLSAYLITDLLLREKETLGHLNVPAFYVRRALRIWPLYFWFIALVLMFPAIEVPNSAFSKVNLITFLLFVGNWSFVFGGRVYSALGPLWSVSIEEQFYFLWPPIVSRLSRKGILIAAAVLIVIANVDRVIEIEIFHHSLGKMWENTFVHLDTLAVGIAIAVLLDGHTPQFKWPARVSMFIGGLLCFALRGEAMFDATGSQGSMALLGYVTVVIGCALFLFAFLGAPIRSNALEYLGKVSFGLYVYHVAAAAVIDRLYPGHGATHEILLPTLSLAATIAIAAISYAILEKPFLLLKKRFTFIESRPA
jgi:peptidoglycan/LPS O-acetylase OafA/YrhL